mgnify:CR=1 FL=1
MKNPSGLKSVTEWTNEDTYPGRNLTGRNWHIQEEIWPEEIDISRKKIHKKKFDNDWENILCFDIKCMCMQGMNNYIITCFNFVTIQVSVKWNDLWLIVNGEGSEIY